jgi:hypothetical protein
MTPRLVLHVGTMKTGTTYLQGRLFANQDKLAGLGVLLPGGSYPAQVFAARELGREPERWSRLADEMREHGGTSVVSTERLAPMRPVMVQKVRDLLDGIDVQVVVTARDLNRSIPALWQESVQNGRTWRFGEYLEGVQTWRPGHRAGVERPEAGRTFWRQLDLQRIVSTWCDAFGVDGVTVVTLPQPGAPRDLLWERFCSVVGIPHEGFQDSTTPNGSLGAASAMAVRRLNELLLEVDLPYPRGGPLRKRVLSKQVLAGRRKDEPSIGLDVAPWLGEQTRRIQDGLARLGVRVIGSTDELEPVAVPGIDPDTLDDTEVTEAALAGLAGLLRLHVEVDGDGLAGFVPR